MGKRITILAVDPSSTCCGVALLRDGVVERVSHWNKNKKLDLGRNLHNYTLFLRRFRAKQQIDWIATEEISHSRNVNTIRKIAYYESQALRLAGEWRAKIMLLKVVQARKLVFGNGSFSKPWVYNKLSKKYKLPPYEKGGNDESDAIVIGLATWKKINV